MPADLASTAAAASAASSEATTRSASSAPSASTAKFQRAAKVAATTQKLSRWAAISNFFAPLSLDPDDSTTVSSNGVRFEYVFEFETPATAKKRDAQTVVIQMLEKRLKRLGLVCATQKLEDGTPQRFLLISALDGFYYQMAERMSLRKDLVAGGTRPFKVVDRYLFRNSDNSTTLFTSGERQAMIAEVIDSIKAHAGDTVALGGFAALVEGEPFVSRLLHAGMISSVFPLHDDRALMALRRSWVGKLFANQPLDEIRSYFGLQISFYFAWLGFYTKSLALPAVLGIALFVLQQRAGTTDIPQAIAYSLFLSMWATFFLEAWKRRSSEYAFSWDVLEYSAEELPRPQFRGKLVRSDITGQLERWEAPHKRYLKCIASFTIISFQILIAVAAMLTCFHFQNMLKDDPYLFLLPTVIYTLSIPSMGMLNKMLAERLTEWENHRTRSDFEAQLIAKRMLFEFPNYYASLFWTAFYLQDMDRVRQQLATMLITMQIVGQLQEVALPYFMGLYRTYELRKNSPSGDAPASVRLMFKVRTEAKKEDYSIFDDHLELIMQFGYVTLFAAAFPLAALCALLNNITEIRSDAFKLVVDSKRPVARTVGGIGMWHSVLEAISAIAVMTNCALILVTSDQLDAIFPGLSLFEKVALVLVIEHAVMLLKIATATIIPDIPEWVSKEVARREYQKQKALEQVQMEEQAKRAVASSPEHPDNNPNAGVSDSAPSAELAEHRESPLAGFDIGLMSVTGAAYAIGATGFNVAALPILYMLGRQTELRKRRWLVRDRALELFNARPKQLMACSESANWLNAAAEAVWLTYNKEMGDWLGGLLGPIIDFYKVPPITSIYFERFAFGKVPPRLSNFVTHHTKSSDTISFSVDISLLSQTDVVLVARMGPLRVPIEATNLELEGRINVELQLTNVSPYLAKISLQFASAPRLDFSLKPLGGDIMQAPGVADAIRGLIVGILQWLMIDQPLVIPLVPEDEASRPRKTVRVQLIEAKSLVAADMTGKSDPYCTLRIGAQRETSQVIDSTLEPRWNETFEFEIESELDRNGGTLFLDVRDQDLASTQSIGNAQIELSRFQVGRREEIWVDLADVQSGQVHLAVTVLDQDTDEDSGVLSVTVYEGTQLAPLVDPVAGKLTEAKLACSIGVGLNETETAAEPVSSSASGKGVDVVWQHSIEVNTTTITNQTLELRVFDDDTGVSYGSCDLDLKGLAAGDVRDKHVALEHCKSGLVHVSTKFTPFTALSVGPRQGWVMLKIMEGRDIHPNTKGVSLRSLSLSSHLVLFCVARVGSQEHTTKHVKKLPAVWNEHFDYQIDDANSQMLRIRVYDNGLLKKTEVGGCALPIADVKEDIFSEHILELYEPDVTPGPTAKSCGQIVVQAMFSTNPPSRRPSVQQRG